MCEKEEIRYQGLITNNEETVCTAAAAEASVRRLNRILKEHEKNGNTENSVPLTDNIWMRKQTYIVNFNNHIS